MPRDVLAQTFLAAAFLLLAAAPGASAQTDSDEEHRRRPPASGGPVAVVLYSETGMRGTAVELTGDQLKLSALAFNDKARSIDVRGGVWLLCSDANLRGRCEYVDRPVSNLGEIGLSGNLSSAQVTTYDKGPRSYDIAFFANSDFRGPFLGFDEGEASLSQYRFNDTAGSVLINRGDWLVCQDNDYRGTCELLEESAADLGAFTLNDAVSSFRRYDVRREGPWRRPIADPVYPSSGDGYGGPDDGVEGETSVFFPAPRRRGARISNRDGAASRFCQDKGFSEAVYKAPGPVLSDVLCR
jgi:Beta/Gamma crystallin